MSDYIHRLGRTGRMGQPGVAISFFCRYALLGQWVKKGNVWLKKGNERKRKGRVPFAHFFWMYWIGLPMP